MERVAIIGGAGLLGQYLVREALLLGYDVLTTYKDTRINQIGIRAEHLDMVDSSEANKVLLTYGPDVVFLPSAMTNVDYCETHPDEAYRINMEGTRTISSICHSIGSKLVYISTDYVFDGEKNGKYREEDFPSPLSVYAKTKLEGERIALKQSDNVVCRVSVLYGWNRASIKKNFVTWVLDEMRMGNKVSLYEDQFVSPTYAPHCANLLLRMADMGARGLYHTSGPDCLNRFRMGLMIAKAFGLDSSLCQKIKMDESRLSAKRSKNSCLDISKFQNDFDANVFTFKQGLHDMRLKESKY